MMVMAARSALVVVALVAGRAQPRRHHECAVDGVETGRDYCGDAVLPEMALGMVADAARDQALHEVLDALLASGPRPVAGGIDMSDVALPEWVAPSQRSLAQRSQAGFRELLVWRLDGYVGVGNALDAYVRAVIEARHRRKRLVVHSVIISKLCAIVRCRLRPSKGPPAAPLRKKRTTLTRFKMGAPRRLAAKAPDTVRYSTFGWRNERAPEEYAGALRELAEIAGCGGGASSLTCVRRAVLRDLIRSPNGTAMARGGLAAVREASVGDTKPPWRAPFAAAIHLRTLDFIEGRNASRRGDGAASDWLRGRQAATKWTCLARRLASLGLGACQGSAHRVFVLADSRAVKVAFAAAVRRAFPAVGVDALDGLEPPVYSTWLEPAPTPAQWLALVGAVADWLSMAHARRVFGLKGTATGRALPSSFARTATVYGNASFETLTDVAFGDKTAKARRPVACCHWADHARWRRRR